MTGIGIPGHDLADDLDILRIVLSRPALEATPYTNALPPESARVHAGRLSVTTMKMQCAIQTIAGDPPDLLAEVLEIPHLAVTVSQSQPQNAATVYRC